MHDTTWYKFTAVLYISIHSPMDFLCKGNQLYWATSGEVGKSNFPISPNISASKCSARMQPADVRPSIRRIGARSMIMGATLLNYSPQYLRERAKQTRAMARTTTCAATLAMLERKAAEYDRMAALLESSATPEPHTEEKLRIPGKRAAGSGRKRIEFRLEVVSSP
jgi:hypothetical protein